VIPASTDWFGNVTPAKEVSPISTDVLAKFYELVDNPDEADFALVCVMSPVSDGYSDKDLETGGNGYMPITLQYRPYTAAEARKHSIASGDPMEQGDRSYYGKTNRADNEAELDVILQTRQKMCDKPVIVLSFHKKPGIVSEYEPQVDGIILHFGVSDQALLEIVSGETEPSGLLPFQIPIDMAAVERHDEDCPGSLTCYEDTERHLYDFGYGLNWKGVIQDRRNQTYRFPYHKNEV
jgi:beta-glucosidase